MTKEEILKYSSENRNDEGSIFMLNQAYKFGSLIFFAVIVVLIAIAFVKWRLTDLYLLLTVLGGYLTGYLIGLYKITNKKNPVTIIVFSLITCGFLIAYASRVLF